MTLKGDKEKLRTKLEAFEAFLNFREKAKQAGFGHHGSDSPIHQFIKAMHKHHAHHGGGHGHCGGSSKGETTVNQDMENYKEEE